MKLFQLPVKILLVLIWSLLATDSVRSQTGNMSDITLPNPNEIMNGSPTDGNTADSNTLTETTGLSDALETPSDNSNTSSGSTNQNSNQAVQETPNAVGGSSDTSSLDTNKSPATTSTPATEKPAQEEETPAQAQATEKAAQEEKKAVEEEKKAVEEEKKAAEENVNTGQLDRVAYEVQFQNAPTDLAIQMQEEFQLNQLINSSGLQIYGKVPSVRDISRRLAELEQQTGKKAAFINISLQKNQLESLAVLPDDSKSAAAKSSTVASSDLKSTDLPQLKETTIRKTVKDTSRKDVIATATQFREEVSNARNLQDTDYRESGQKLYNVLIKPLEAQLQANNIDILVFSMDSGLRLLPLAALYDGKQFLVEKYATAIVPSFGLTDTRYVDPAKSSILAMGASEFTDQPSLPTMGIELKTIVSDPRKGEAFLNKQFTIPNFIAQNSRKNSFQIIHLGTHAEFKAGDLNDSYIQFYDGKLRIPQLRNISDKLGWNTANTPIELLVLSACDTAIGDEKAELGFAGLAVQAGVKSALASLWYVSDLGTLALMGEFYNQLDSTLIKAEALQQTQLEMLHGKVNINDKRVDLSNGEKLALPKEFPEGNLSLAHPYFWSSFTLIGNWN
ncbi:CHAT domain-containing protein [Pleurocapsa sp. FMAR1]|uniref:CHAT domain-containing protein n=1 Tax=Pleurocapsa sp. FMAR1 TaxID=3040204 RepID=UPI0029C9A9F5|nr:CHAT domain-containing protein [Pleurocapsa sp. FMAR1]